MSTWEEAQGQTYVQVEKLHPCTGQGTPRHPQSELTDVARESEV